MNNDLRDQTQFIKAQQSTVGIFMQQVYLWMTAALGITGLVAYFTANSPVILSLFSNVLMVILMIVVIFGLVIYLRSAIHKLSAGTATGLLLLYAAFMGILLGPTLLFYTTATVARAFFISAGMFGGMSVFGMITKRDLSGLGSFLIMGLFGLIIAMVVNIFLRSSGLDWGISVIGVLIFTGLTAYDTQRLKEMGESAPLDDGLAIRRGAILGALTLYLDFINLFLMLLRLLGNRD